MLARSGNCQTTSDAMGDAGAGTATAATSATATSSRSVVAFTPAGASALEDDQNEVRLRSLLEQERRIVSRVLGADKTSVWHVCQNLRDACDMRQLDLELEPQEQLQKRKQQQKQRLQQQQQQRRRDLDRKSRMSVARTQEAAPCGRSAGIGASNPHSSKLVEKVIAKHRIDSGCNGRQFAPTGQPMGGGRSASKTRGPSRVAATSAPSADVETSAAALQTKAKAAQQRGQMPEQQQQQQQQQQQLPAGVKPSELQREHQHQHKHQPHHQHQPQPQLQPQPQHQPHHEHYHPRRERRAVSVATPASMTASSAASSTPPSVDARRSSVVRSTPPAVQQSSRQQPPISRLASTAAAATAALRRMRRQNQPPEGDNVRRRIRFLPLATALTRSGLRSYGDAEDSGAGGIHSDDWCPDEVDIRRLTRRRRLDTLMSCPLGTSLMDGADDDRG